MNGAADHGEPIAGYFAPVHRALTEQILLGGAPRSLAIVNGTLAGAIGLGLRLWIAGLVIWAIGHALSVWAARRAWPPPRPRPFGWSTAPPRGAATSTSPA